MLELAVAAAAHIAGVLKLVVVVAGAATMLLLLLLPLCCCAAVLLLLPPLPVHLLTMRLDSLRRPRHRRRRVTM
jgi:hypothetical protein